MSRFNDWSGSTVVLEKGHNPQQAHFEASIKSFLNQWVKTHGRHEDIFAAAMERFLRAQLDAAIEGVTKGLRNPEKILPDSVWLPRLKQTAKPHLIRGAISGARMVLQRMKSVEALLGTKDPDSILIDIPKRAMQALRETVSKTLRQPYWKKILKTGREALGKAIEASLQNKENLTEMVARIFKVMGSAIGPRAITIARTETTGALNGGSTAVIDELTDEGITEGKSWLSTLDQFCRPAHVAANGQIANAKGLFTVGGEKCPYPGYYKLSARNRVNCRCTTVSVMTIKLFRYHMKRCRLWDKFNPNQPRVPAGSHDGGQFAGGSSGLSGISYQHFGTSDGTVKVEASGQVRLKKPKSVAQATSMLEAMTKIHRQATDDHVASQQLPVNNPARVKAELRWAHTKIQLSRAVAMAQPFAAKGPAELRKLIDAILAEFDIQPDDSEADHELEKGQKFNPNHDNLGRFAHGQGHALGGRQTPAAVISQPSSEYAPANAHGADTQARFQRDDGSYTPQRAALHRAIVAKHAGDAEPVEQPVAVLMGGGSASGKGTLLKAGVVTPPKTAVHIDADEIKKDIPEFREMTAGKNPKAAAYAHEESSHISNQLIAHAATESKNMVYDSTGDSGIEKLTKKVNQMRASGHAVHAHYVTVDTAEAIKRSDKRGERTGRFVPHETIKQIHASVSAVLPQAIQRGLFDEVTLWDNNDATPRKVVSAKGSKMEIHDAALWQRFLDKAKAVDGLMRKFNPDQPREPAGSPAGGRFAGGKGLPPMSELVESVDFGDATKEEIEAIHEGLAESLQAGDYKLKLRELIVGDKSPNGDNSCSYGNGRIYINKKFLAEAKNVDPAATEAELGGFNFAWQRASTTKEAIKTMVAHEVGHHADYALLLDSAAAVRKVGAVSESDGLKLSAYATWNSSEKFAEAHAMISMGKSVPDSVRRWYDATVATADKEPIARYLR